MPRHAQRQPDRLFAPVSKLDEAARAAFAVSAILALVLAGCSEPGREIGPTATSASPTVESASPTPTASLPPTAEPTLRPPTPRGSTPSPVVPTPSPIVEVEATVAGLGSAALLAERG